MVPHRHKNANWVIPAEPSLEYARLALLMDIRDELQSIVGLLRCHRIPAALDAIKRMDRDGIKRRVSRKRKATK
jgi:hypothetical protein